MSMLRNSSVTQLKRINSEIKKQGGQTDRSSDTEKKFANLIYMRDPISTNMDTYNITTIPDPTENELKMKNEKVYFFDKNGKWFGSSDNINDISRYLDRFDDISFSVDGYKGTFKNLNDFELLKKSSMTPYTLPNTEEKFKKDAEKMKNENMKINENGPNDNPIDIMKNMKTLRDWQTYTSKPRKERDILNAGRFIETDKVKGYINRIVGSDVYIETLDGSGIIKVNIKDVVKGKKSDIKDEIKGTPLNGPANFTVAKLPKEEINTYSPKIDAKSTPAPDNKISKKNNVEKIIKENNFNITKFSDFNILENYEYENFTINDMDDVKELYDDGMTSAEEIALETDLDLDTVIQIIYTLKKRGDIEELNEDDED